MELEELQKAWKELNERVNQNELVHQQQIIEMLSRQKESCLQRMLRLEKGGFCFLLGMTLLILMDFIYLKGQLVFWQATFGILLYVLTLNFIGIIKLEKIKTERNLEEQIKNVLNTKNYFIGAILQDTQLLPYSSVYFFIITINGGWY